MVLSGSQGSTRERFPELRNQNKKMASDVNPFSIPQPASKQGIHTEPCSGLKGDLFGLVEVYFQEVSMEQEAPARY